MAKKFPLIFILASNLFLSGVLSVSILTIENRCNDKVWPAIYSWSNDTVSPTGFALKPGESRAIHAPSSWDGLISGRTLCSNGSTGRFSCVTGDCESNEIKCSLPDYGWAPVTYIYFRINYGGTNTYIISLEKGYNLPLMVAPSNSTGTCISSACAVDLNTMCPDDLKTLAEGYLVSCSSECQKDETDESCCTNYFKSKENCKKTMYTQNFEHACPLAYVYPFSENNKTIVCPYSTDYVITFCPSILNNTIRSSMPPTAEAKDDSLRKLKPILGGSVALAVMIIIVAATLIVREKNARRNKDSNLESVEAAIMLKRYSYKSVEKMTNSFAHVLGKGGFGTVYKGKLPDSGSQDIAVKILDESKGNGKDFINELASMSRASHVNIVSLFGFCCEGSKRAIIYEYMPNGSLDKFISENMSTNMEWKTLYNIAVGIARGLEYLHNSCVSKIVHFDIKPQNILIDQDFCPKISDFGLAKLWKNKESIILMSDARGTAGYIAPEMFSKSNGGVSHKSDVYSYGMVVLEMIGATNKERFESFRSNSKTMYFPDWIYEHLEKKVNVRLLEDHILEEDEKIEKKMTLVGLWCIQTIPSDRPPMRKVVEMLAGNLEALEVPPKPPLNLPIVTVWEGAGDSQETSSFWTPS